MAKNERFDKYSLYNYKNMKIANILTDNTFQIGGSLPARRFASSGLEGGSRRAFWFPRIGGSFSAHFLASSEVEQDICQS